MRFSGYLFLIIILSRKFHGKLYACSWNFHFSNVDNHDDEGWKASFFKYTRKKVKWKCGKFFMNLSIDVVILSIFPNVHPFPKCIQISLSEILFVEHFRKRGSDYYYITPGKILFENWFLNHIFFLFVPGRITSS